MVVFGFWATVTGGLIGGVLDHAPGHLPRILFGILQG